jgi:Rieske Fe-S protein
MTDAMNRRRWLHTLTALGASLPCAGCVASQEGTSATIVARDAGTGETDAADAAACAEGPVADPTKWLEVPLASVPDLASHGAASVDDDAALVHVWIVALGGDCYRAIWKICTHGACELGFNDTARRLECPCHGARFGLDGAVLNGPATAPVRVLAVQRSGDSLFVRRPFA